jgi:hypothetical protein
MRTKTPGAAASPDELADLLPPTIIQTDYQALIRRHLTEGASPGDPDRRLASEAPAPAETAIIFTRAQRVGESARQTARRNAREATKLLQKRKKALAQLAAENQPQIEDKQTRKAQLEELQQFYDTELRSIAYRPLGRAETVRYYGTQALLALADIGNIAAASVNVLGDPLPLAIIQGLGVGVANVTVGQIGAEVRERRERAKRPHTSPDDGEAYESWYGADGGERQSNWALWIAGAAVSLTMIGQLAWRSVFDGAPIGLVYAAFAVVVVAGSFINSYVHGGLDGAQRYKSDLDAESTQVSADISQLKQPDAEAAGLQAEIEAIEEAWTAHGEAIAELALTEAYTLMVQNPMIYGTHASPIRAFDEDDLDDESDLDEDDSAPEDQAATNSVIKDPFDPSSNGGSKAAAR